MTADELTSPDLLAVVEAAEDATTSAQLVATFTPFLARLGVRTFFYGQATTPQGVRAPAVQIGHQSLDWNRHYADNRLAAKDGMFPRALSSTDPFTWQGLLRRDQLDDAGIDVLHQARSFGLRDGLVVPIHNLNGSSAAVVMMGDAQFDWSPRQRVTAHVLAIYFAGLGRKLVAGEASDPQPVLSRRQRECLQWVRAGKTDWEIGKILNLSEHTVKEYLHTARQRLGVHTRAQAVIEAITRGLISV